MTTIYTFLILSKPLDFYLRLDDLKLGVAREKGRTCARRQRRCEAIRAGNSTSGFELRSLSCSLQLRSLPDGVSISLRDL